jgi:predicted Rossmann fold flavoprotein
MIDGVAQVTERGEVQFTDYGLSGIPIFQLSREAAYALRRQRSVVVAVDFFPDYDQKGYEDFIARRFKRAGGLDLAGFLLGTAHKKINQVMIRLSGCRGTEPVTELGVGKVGAILQRYRALHLNIKAVNPFAQAQVCAGGVSLAEVDEHLESSLMPGIFFAGEMLNVDGKCGGYNLQWAWSSGYVTGWQAAHGMDKQNKKR